MRKRVGMVRANDCQAETARPPDRREVVARIDPVTCGVSKLVSSWKHLPDGMSVPNQQPTALARHFAPCVLEHRATQQTGDFDVRGVVSLHRASICTTTLLLSTAA